MVSFVEYYRRMGVEGITIYSRASSPAIQAVLHHYRSIVALVIEPRREGMVTLVEWTWPPALHSLLDYGGQKMMLQDCLLRYHVASYCHHVGVSPWNHHHVGPQEPTTLLPPRLLGPG